MLVRLFGSLYRIHLRSRSGRGRRRCDLWHSVLRHFVAHLTDETARWLLLLLLSRRSIVALRFYNLRVGLRVDLGRAIWFRRASTAHLVGIENGGHSTVDFCCGLLTDTTC